MFEDLDEKIKKDQENSGAKNISAKKDSFSIDKEIKDKNDLMSEGAKTSVPHIPVLKEFDDRIKKLRDKGKKRGKRYSVIGISASIIISIGVLIGGYYLFTEIINITDEVKQKEDVNEFASILDPENICKGDSCCLASLEKIKKNNFSRFDPDIGCPTGYGENKLYCETSLSWCEPVEQEQEEVDRCTLVPYPGPCEAAIEKYYFNPQAGECQSFYWGGCEGVVPFESLEDCMQACGVEIDAVKKDVDGELDLVEKNVDSDNDGLVDDDEIIYGTDPDNPDTDGDGYLDGEEVKNGFNPAGEGVLENSNTES